MVIVRQLLTGLVYMHSLNIIHRDLKPENVLLHAKTNRVKISDFGSSILHDTGTKLSDIQGTPYYTAPEVLCRSYDNKCDIWSLGVITFILLSGMAPFYGKTNEDIIKMIKKGQFKFEGWVWLTVSEHCKHFIKALLTVDPDLRPNASEALQHPWLSQPEKLPLNEDKGLSHSGKSSAAFLHKKSFS